MHRKSLKVMFTATVMTAAIMVGALIPLLKGQDVSAATVNHTRDEAVAWCKALIGKPGEDVDGAPKNYDAVGKIQCVDLIRKYTQWLGKDLGKAQGSGAAYNFGTQSIPTDYYQRYTNSTNPQPGDIFVWNACDFA